jgi:FkbM family methyltransferase
MLFLEKIKEKYPSLTNIFEIGAHRGYDIDEIIKYWPEANIYAFEADPYNYEICKNRLEKYRNTYLFNIAISDQNGKVSFNRFCDIEKIPDCDTLKGLNLQFTGCGSIKKPGIGLKNIYKIENVVEEIIVDTMTLDSFCTVNKIESIDAIFMDVQGAEMDVINGCKNFITSTKALILEWSTNYVLYEDETDFKLIKKHLELLGLYECQREYQIQNLNGDSLFMRLGL